MTCDRLLLSLVAGKEHLMAIVKRRTIQKKFLLDPRQITRAKKAQGAATDTETIVLALDHVISESERNRLALKANRKFLKSGIVLRDAFGALL